MLPFRREKLRRRPGESGLILCPRSSGRLVSRRGGHLTVHEDSEDDERDPGQLDESGDLSKDHHADHHGRRKLYGIRGVK